MLVVTLKDEEFVKVGDWAVRVVRIRGNRVQLGIVAPREVPVECGPRIPRSAFGLKVE